MQKKNIAVIVQNHTTLDTAPHDIENIGIVTENLSLEPSEFNQLIQYYLDPAHLPTLKSEILKQLFLLSVALSGFGLYAVPAYDYGISEYGQDISMFLLVNLIVDSCVPALAVLYNAAEVFLTMRAADQVPAELKHLLATPLTPAQQRLEDIGIGVGSFISAIPLALLAYLYPVPGISLALQIVLAIVVEFDNTVLHFLPLKLAMQEPLYRFPLLPFEYVYRYLQNKRLTAAERYQKEQEEMRLAIYQNLKLRLIYTLTLSQKNINLNGLDFDNSIFSSISNNSFQTLQQSIHSKDKNNLDKLLAIAEYGNRIKPGKKSAACTKIDSYLQKIAYGIGAALVDSSCIGYLAAPINALATLTGSLSLACMLAAPPIYFLIVLLAFFGGNSLRDTYNYATKWDKDIIKIPTVFKLYFKSSALLILIAAYLSVFSYAAGKELIEDNFSDEKWDTIRPFLFWFTQIGLPFLAFTAMLNYYQLVIEKFATHFGNNDAKTVVLANAIIDQLKNGFRLMKGEIFIDTLDKLEESQLQTLLSMSKDEFNDARAPLKLTTSINIANTNADMESSPLLKSSTSLPFYKRSLATFCPFLFQKSEELSNKRDATSNDSRFSL